MGIIIFLFGFVFGFFGMSYWLKRKLIKRQKKWQVKDIFDEK